MTLLSAQTSVSLIMKNLVNEQPSFPGVFVAQSNWCYESIGSNRAEGSDLTCCQPLCTDQLETSKSPPPPPPGQSPGI